MVLLLVATSWLILRSSLVLVLRCVFVVPLLLLLSTTVLSSILIAMHLFKLHSIIHGLQLLRLLARALSLLDLLHLMLLLPVLHLRGLLIQHNICWFLVADYLWFLVYICPCAAWVTVISLSVLVIFWVVLINKHLLLIIPFLAHGSLLETLSDPHVSIHD